VTKEQGVGVAKKAKDPKRITRYTYDSASDPATPETGHTALIGEERVVTMDMDNGWSKAIDVGKLPTADQSVIIDMEPAYDPVLFWAGKRNRREVALLPLQRNELVTESRIGRIVQRVREVGSREPKPLQITMFADLEKASREEERDRRVEFYTHEEGWKNKLICGDSLEVMQSLLTYEDLRGKVQMIYVDPPYGIKYDANFQQRVDSIRNNDKDRADDVLTIRAFRDTWYLGVHSYASYLEERLYACRDLLSDTGSIFVQINDERVHLIRVLLDEVFGQANFCSLIAFKTVTGQSSSLIPSVTDYLAWYAKDRSQVKYRRLYVERDIVADMQGEFRNYELPDGSIHPVKAEHIQDPAKLPAGARLFRSNSATSGEYSATGTVEIDFGGVRKHPGPNAHWKTTEEGMRRLHKLKRLLLDKGPGRMFKQYRDDFPLVGLVNNWMDLRGEQNRMYSTQTHERVISRCLLMTTDPGELTFDPTCGSGTSAIVAEKFGRRWVTCDTSRVGVNVARMRLLSATFDQFVTRGNGPKSGFVYRTVPRVGLESLARDLEPEVVELVDQPRVDSGALRVTGPFEIMTLGRYSSSDWRGYVAKSKQGNGDLENYITVICHLYRTQAVLTDSTGLVHAIEDAPGARLAISVGPISGRVTARQIYDAAKEAEALGIDDVHVLGWAFEANVGEVKSEIDAAGAVSVHLVMIRPDSLAEGLKVTKPEMLFSPLALPEVDIKGVANDGFTVRLKGVAVFDHRSKVTGFKQADSGYVSAWYLDEDYDGDCFVDCQMFFDFKKKPAVEKTLGVQVDPEEWTLRLISDPFAAGKYRRVAVKVVDVYGNESTVVKDVP
jgi:adenine-specific DNA-methyltransferase